MASNRIQPDAIFEGYTGTKIFHVSHPDHKRSLRVAAPTEEAAIVAAAEHWKVHWQEYGFYAFTTVTPG